MIEMNYKCVVPLVRGLMSLGATCPGCGRPFDDALDIGVTHIVPPRHRQDWARMHARNTWIGCKSCCRTLWHQPFEVWFDEQWDANRSAGAWKRVQ